MAPCLRVGGGQASQRPGWGGSLGARGRLAGAAGGGRPPRRCVPGRRACAVSHGQQGGCRWGGGLVWGWVGGCRWSGGLVWGWVGGWGWAGGWGWVGGCVRLGRVRVCSTHITPRPPTPTTYARAQEEGRYSDAYPSATYVYTSSSFLGGWVWVAGWGGGWGGGWRACMHAKDRGCSRPEHPSGWVSPPPACPPPPQHPSHPTTPCACLPPPPPPPCLPALMTLTSRRPGVRRCLAVPRNAGGGVPRGRALLPAARAVPAQLL